MAEKDNAREQLKWKTARELGLDDDLAAGGDELTVREAGKIGGQMVRKLVERGEEALEEATDATAETAERATATGEQVVDRTMEAARKAAQTTVRATERARDAAGKALEATGERLQAE
ncbi:MAG: alpha/beta-type small acid-soluble spore protein [Thermoanaerobacterales bacterium]|nr:alpha/beta-type small acid-soluble spore protein [Thermoanaerobacterales bacterium]